MSTSDHIRRAGESGLAAGVLYGLEGVILLFEPRSGGWLYLVYSLFAGAVLLTIVALLGLHFAQKSRDGRLGTIAVWIATLGLSCLAITAGARVASGREPLDILFLVGFLLIFLGYVLFGVAILRAGVLPRWSAPLPALGVVAAVLLQDKRGAGIAMGVVWALLGYVVLSADRDVPSSVGTCG